MRIRSGMTHSAKIEPTASVSLPRIHLSSAISELAVHAPDTVTIQVRIRIIESSSAAGRSCVPKGSA